MGRFLDWLGQRLLRKEKSRPRTPPLRATGSHVRPKPPRAAARAPSRPTGSPGPARFRAELDGRIEDGGPGKNILIRNRYVREDTGTHEKLTIIDEQSLQDDNEKGFDPYNTGQFDRSRNWSKRPK